MYIYIYIYIRPISIRVKVITSGPGFDPMLYHIRNSKMVLDTSVLNIQHCKVLFKAKCRDSWKRVAASSTPQCSSY